MASRSVATRSILMSTSTSGDFAGTIALANPRRAASARRRDACGTCRTSPPKPTSPKAITFGGTGLLEIADNTAKGVSPREPAAITVHFSPAFSEENYGLTEAEVLARARPVIDEWLGSEITGTSLHRWRYSEPKSRHREPCVWLPEDGLGLAGDGLGGPKVEGAATSAFALAERMTA